MSEPTVTTSTMPVDRSGITHKVEISDATHGGVVEGYITANVGEDGTMKEVFLHGFGKEGSTFEGWTQFSAILLSLALQSGASFGDLAARVGQMKFEPYGFTNNGDIPWTPSVPAYIMAWLVLRFGTAEQQAQFSSVMKEWQS